MGMSMGVEAMGKVCGGCGFARVGWSHMGWFCLGRFSNFSSNTNTLLENDNHDGQAQQDTATHPASADHIRC
jgi:hypothetical protein